MSNLIAGLYSQLTETTGRLIAPNAGFMTGPGTNTYFVGDADGVAVIDPGPLDAGHVGRISEVSPGPIRSILVTHTHRDHSPAATPLKSETGARIYGMAAPGTPENDPVFAPDTYLDDGDTIAIGDVIIQAVHTPGHASNHLCYLIPAERMLFTGDHLMNGSTVVIAPPDGDMAAYIDSLEKIKELGLATIGPGHGDLIMNPDAVIDWTIAHRFEREEKIVAALGRHAAAAIDELVHEVYGDVDSRVHGIAKYSLWAHLEKLLADGSVSRREQLWWLNRTNTQER